METLYQFVRLGAAGCNKRPPTGPLYSLDKSVCT